MLYTATIVADQAMIRREFSDFVDALDFLSSETGKRLDFAQAYSDVHAGRGLCMYIRAKFVTLAVLH